MIYPYKFRETINHEFLDFFDKLEEVNVAKKDCLDAAKFINTNHNNINEWWYSDRLQTVRENFSNIFARKNKDSLKILIKSLKDNQLP